MTRRTLRLAGGLPGYPPPPYSLTTLSLFVRKPLAQLSAEAAAGGAHSLRRVLGPWQLIAFGVGCIVGAGLFSVTGYVASDYAGPAIVLSFLFAALGCAFSGLCYAEFASMIPVAGSAYTYSYATMGELIAWIIGWDLVLEYSVAATMVSISWSSYLTHFLAQAGWELPAALTACPFDGGVANLPAAIIIIAMSLLLIRGTEQSSWVNTVIVILKLGIILTFIVLGWRYIRAENYVPFIPANTGKLGEFGWSGVLRGAAVVFFAFLGFDAISTAAQETRNPKRNMPIGILGSLLVATVLYFVFAHVMTGVANYREFAGHEGIAPVAIAIDHMGTVGADGHVVPAYPWMNKLIVLAILVGYCSVILVQLLAQSRIFMAMSRDGLLPPIFSKINTRYRTPALNQAIFMVIISLLAVFVPARVAGEMTSIDTLLAFTLVCAGVLITRRTMPDAPRAFRTPLVPLIPVLGILTCLGLMLFLPADTWIRLVVWMVIGFDIYSLYGLKRSKLADASRPQRRGVLTLDFLGLAASFLCIVTGFWHQQSVGWAADKTLLVIAVIFGLAHLAFYLVRMWRHSYRTKS